MRLGQILSAVAGAAILMGLVLHFGVADIGNTLSRADPLWLLCYLAVSTLILLTYGFRWHRIAATLGPVSSLHRLVIVRTVADGVSSLIPPGRMAGDSLRIGFLHADGTPATTAGASVMLDRFCEATGNTLAAVSYVGIIAINSSGHEVGLKVTALTLGILFLFLLSIIVSLYVGVAPLSPPVAALTRLIPRVRPLLDALVRIEQQIHHALRDHPGVFLQGIGLSILIEMGIAGQYRLLLHGFGLDVSLPQLAMVILGSGLARAVPAPAALGALEASQVALLGSIGVAPQFGFVVGAVLRLHETFWLAVAAAFALASGFNWRPATQANEVSIP